MKNEDNNIPLIMACLNEQPEIAEYLIKCGAGMNIRNKDGDTALILSYHLKNKNIPLIKLLYENGANLSIKKKEKELFISLIKDNDKNKKEKLKDIFNSKRNDGHTALTFSCKIRNIEEIKNLIEFGVDNLNELKVQLMQSPRISMIKNSFIQKKPIKFI